MPFSFLLSLGLLALLLPVNELARRFKWAAIAFFFILPIAMIPVWLSSGIEDWFRWVKLISVVLACVLLCLMRYTPIGGKVWARTAIMLVLAANILEACIQDAISGAPWNWLNAAAGLLSILSLTGWRKIACDASGERDIIWSGLDWAYVIAYTVWNWTFVYFNFPEYAFVHAAVLLAPIIMNARKGGTWGQTRAFTLATWMMLEFTFSAFTAKCTYAIPRTEAFAWALGGLSLAANAAVSFRVMIMRRRTLRR
jgi:hypothetical protein